MPKTLTVALTGNPNVGKTALFNNLTGARQHVANCSFSDCTHTHEPGCAVQRALASGEIHPARYESYLRMRAGDQSD